jgi:hypothetical protein
MSLQLFGVPVQLCQIVARIGSVQVAGVDQTHKEIADSGAVQRLVEECISPLSGNIGSYEPPRAGVHRRILR